MRLVKFLSAVLSVVIGWIRVRSKQERIIDRLLATPEGRQKLAAAMVEPRRCGGLTYRCRGNATRLDVTKVRPGDRVVFANPQAGRDHDIAAAKSAGLKVGHEYTVRGVDLGDWTCSLRLSGYSADFNAVQFDSSSGHIPLFEMGSNPKIRVSDLRAAGLPIGLLPHQVAAKAEVDKFLGGRPGTGTTRIIHGPRCSGKTHLAHMIHKERGGVIVVRSPNAVADFRRSHKRMFATTANVVTVARVTRSGFCWGNATVVLDVDEEQYRTILPYVLPSNKVVYLHECNYPGGGWRVSGCGRWLCKSPERGSEA